MKFATKEFVGIKIRQQRKWLGLTQEQLVLKFNSKAPKAAHITRDILAKVELGVIPLSAERYLMIMSLSPKELRHSKKKYRKGRR